LYDDRHGVIGTIGKMLADADVNIEDMRNPHDQKTNRSLAILKVNQQVTDDLLTEIKEKIDATASFCIKF